LIDEKTEGRKSRETVPLSKKNQGVEPVSGYTGLKFGTYSAFVSACQMSGQISTGTGIPVRFDPIYGNFFCQ
jgi:hypothetical protein